MKSNIFGKKESLFATISLAIFCILCLIKFIIAISKISNFVDYSGLLEEVPLSSFNTFRAVSIVALCFSIVSFIISFVLLAVRNKNVNSALMIINFTLLILIVIFFFTIRFSCGELLDLNNLEDEMYFINNYLINQCWYVILSSIITSVISVINYHMSNLIYNSKKKEVKETSANIIKSETELELESGIEKLKSQIRIKNLEKEYVKLKGELDSE